MEIAASHARASWYRGAMMGGWLGEANRAVAALIAAGRWLVLPVSLLLFLQWPLRDLVHAYSIAANDLAQWLFALYVSLALTEATRVGTHLAAASFAQRYSPRMRRVIAKVAILLCVMPWSIFVLVAGAPSIWQSVRTLEAFPETANPGYFLVKASAFLLALLMLTQALLDVLSAKDAR
ncbi:MAG TPA: TRAP transporter small permease subunit [Stellaceae bacterium]|nr:TRAP transporter small permease subunit [Stellaceae bacterium]